MSIGGRRRAIRRTPRTSRSGSAWRDAGTIGRLDIRSPAAGLVLQRNVEPGQVVSGGSGALFRIARGGEMEMRAQLPQQEWR
jgi:multidrug resistance efflux pump